MYKHFIIISNTVFLICLSVIFSGLLSGCDSRSELPQKPEIVYKKIIAKSKGAPESAKTTPGKITPTGLNKPDLAPKVDISRTRDVKISKRRPALSSKPQKMALKPKSDIAKIKIAKKRQETCQPICRR